MPEVLERRIPCNRGYPASLLLAEFLLTGCVVSNNDSYSLIIVDLCVFKLSQDICIGSLIHEQRSKNQ